jgi:hypothetical protein
VACMGARARLLILRPLSDERLGRQHQARHALKGFVYL